MRGREIPIVFLTGRSALRDRMRGFDLGAVDYITKPFDPTEVGPRLRLERLDGTPADPPSFRTTVLAWSPGDQIPLGSRTLQVVRIRHDDADELPVRAVEKTAA